MNNAALNNNEMTDFPQINPHDGRENDMLLSGEKACALFIAPETPSEDILKSAEKGALAFRKIDFARATPSGKKSRRAQSRAVFAFWSPERAESLQAAQKLIDIMTRVFQKGEKLSNQTEAEIGRLLSYSEEDIAFYLDWKTSISASLGAPPRETPAQT